MIPFKIGLLLCTLAGSIDAFAVVHHEPALQFGVRSRTLSSSTNTRTSLSMVGTAADTATTTPPPPSPPPPPPPELKPPLALYEGAVAAGAAKASAPFGKIFKLGIVAGCHIAFGAYLAISVGGACPGLAATNPGLQKIVMGAFGLPFGLIMTLVTGAELFTGNTALVTAAKQEGKIGYKDLAKNWIASYLGNFVGSILLAYLAYKSGTLGAAPGAVNTAMAKCSMAWDVAFVRGILCNWLVCQAVYMASGCSSMIGKMTAVWFPISAFVALGLDHSVANMFIIPLGMLRGAEITIAQMFVKNLIPVTLGNIVGGAVCVMAPYGMTFGNWFKKKD